MWAAALGFVRVVRCVVLWLSVCVVFVVVCVYVCAVFLVCPFRVFVCLF